MSLLSQDDPQTATCPQCDTEDTYLVTRNINASWKPFYREKIMDGSFHRVKCTHCGEEFFVDVPLHYCDFKRNEWIMMYPLVWEPQWRQWVNDVNVSYDAAYAGPETPPFLRDNPPPMWRRAVFGLPALREKLVLHDAGIDDVALEAFKMQMMLQNDKASPFPEYRPRCIAIDDKAMLFSQWVDGGDALEPSAVTLSRTDFLTAREMLQGTALLEQLGTTPYVDLGAIMYLEEPADA